MARCTQFIGHTKDVMEFLDSCVRQDKVDIIEGIAGEEVCLLHNYIDISGDVWVEFEQYCPWSSGPMIFLGIKNKNTNEVKGWKEVKLLSYCDSEYIDSDRGEFYV